MLQSPVQSFDSNVTISKPQTSKIRQWGRHNWIRCWVCQRAPLPSPGYWACQPTNNKSCHQTHQLNTFYFCSQPYISLSPTFFKVIYHYYDFIIIWDQLNKKRISDWWKVQNRRIWNEPLIAGDVSLGLDRCWGEGKNELQWPKSHVLYLCLPCLNHQQLHSVIKNYDHLNWKVSWNVSEPWSPVNPMKMVIWHWWVHDLNWAGLFLKWVLATLRM